MTRRFPGTRPPANRATRDGLACAHFAEIVRRVDDALAEMVMPNAIDDPAPGQRVLWIGAHLASAARRAPSSLVDGESNRRQSRTHESAPGVAGSPGFLTSPRFSTELAAGSGRD